MSKIFRPSSCQKALDATDSSLRWRPPRRIRSAQRRDNPYDPEDRSTGNFCTLLPGNYSTLFDRPVLSISVDTLAAHCAGAMGHPIRVALPATPEWRWGRDATTTAWYPVGDAVPAGAGPGVGRGGGSFVRGVVNTVLTRWVLQRTSQ